MTSFSSVFIEAPGDCSPSRSVVSKMSILRVMPSFFLLSSSLLFFFFRQFAPETRA